MRMIMDCNPFGKSVKYYDGHYWVQITDTLHGDYVGTTIEKSNHDYLIELIGEKNVESCDFASWDRGCRWIYTGHGVEDEVLMFEPNTMAVSLCGDYSSRELWIRSDWPSLPKVLENLQNYPVLNEDHLSEYEWSLRLEAVEELADSFANTEEFAEWRGREKDLADLLSSLLLDDDVPVHYDQAFVGYINEDDALNVLRNWRLFATETA